MVGNSNQILVDLVVHLFEIEHYQVGYFQQVRPMDMTVREFNEDFRTWDHSYASNVRYGLFQGPGDYGEDIIMHAVVTYPTELGYAGEGAKFIMTDCGVHPSVSIASL